MSSKNTLLLTNDHNEEIFIDGTEPYLNEEGFVKDAITIEFNKDNIRIDRDDEDDLIITITNVNSELYKIFEQIGKLATKEQK